ncbi:MAG TPA: hypothetical protein VLS92_07965 [Acidimicrobiia bacterium]|nr:hypothetical protein [Acidimicrobiia bacterium]
MYQDLTSDASLRTEPCRAPDVDVLDAAVGLEMRGLVDETTQQRFGRDALEIARERVEQGLTFSADTPLWSTREYRGYRGWAERWAPDLSRFAQGLVFGAGTLFVFLLLWFSDLSQHITPAGGVVVAVSVYLASAGWSRLMSVAAGGVVYYSLVEADRQLTRYVVRAVVTLALLTAVIALGYLAGDSFTDTLGPGWVVMATIANLTLFWLSLAYVVAQRRPWLILLFAAGGVAGFLIAGAAFDPSAGMHMQVSLAAFNVVSVLYMIGRAVMAYHPRYAFLELSEAAPLPARRRRFLASLGIGYGLLILSDFVILAAVGYFDSTRNGTEIYLVLKLVAIIPLVVSLGVMEILEFRLGETVRKHEQRFDSSDPRFTAGIRRAFYLSVLGFGGLHVLLGLAAATLLLPGMPLRGLVAESTLTADIIVPGLLATFGIMFALGGMFCATLLSTIGEDEVILKWLLIGLALSLAVGGGLYPALGMLGAAIGFAAGSAAFLVLGARTIVACMAAYPLLSYRRAIA